MQYKNIYNCIILIVNINKNKGIPYFYSGYFIFDNINIYIC